MKYCVFETNWGHFGLGGTEDEVCVTELPGPDAGEVESSLLSNLAVVGRKLSCSTDRSPLGPVAQWDSSYFGGLQEQITAYFRGERIVFATDIPLNLEHFSSFAVAVLLACRGIEIGQTITYAALAALAGRPKASRAVGGVMAANPMPLIIPCHRVLRSDGGLGGFSAPGGVTLKRSLLEHERQCVPTGSASHDPFALAYVR